jgi:hypothetical protein
MSKMSRAVRVAGLFFVLAGGALPLGGCNTGGGVPQQLEPTKPRMDREKETDRPAENPAPAK